MVNDGGVVNKKEHESGDCMCEGWVISVKGAIHKLIGEAQNKSIQYYNLQYLDIQRNVQDWNEPNREFLVRERLWNSTLHTFTLFYLLKHPTHCEIGKYCHLID